MRKPYTEVIENGHTKRIYNEFPDDKAIERLSYASELRERAVHDRRLFDRPQYRSPEELQDYDPDWQEQCAITEHAILWGETHT